MRRVAPALVVLAACYDVPAAAPDAGEAPAVLDAWVPSGATDGGPADPIATFWTDVAPIIGGPDGKNGACGVCHAYAAGVGPGFMIPNPDLLTTLLVYPGIIGPTPERSRLYAKGAHAGRAFTAQEAVVVGGWITLFARAGTSTAPGERPAGDGGVPVSPARPRIEPFVPVMGANVVDLYPLDRRLRGVTVSFEAEVIGTMDPSLHLRAITVTPTARAGVRLVHPLWSQWPLGGDPIPDPADSFDALDQSVAPGAPQALGPGRLILLHYTPGTKINVTFFDFDVLGEAANPMPVMGRGCRAVAAFTASAQPTLSGRCARCHGGPDEDATRAFSLAGIADLATDPQSRACEATLGQVTPTDPDQSRIYRFPDPAAQPSHPFKLTAAELAAFRQSANDWIVREQ